jgi:hypothetical protein
VKTYDHASHLDNYETSFSPDPALEGFGYQPYLAVGQSKWKQLESNPTPQPSTPGHGRRYASQLEPKTKEGSVLDVKQVGPYTTQKETLTGLLKVVMSKGELDVCARALSILFQVVDPQMMPEFLRFFTFMIEASMMIYEQAGGEHRQDIQNSTLAMLESTLGTFPIFLVSDGQKLDRIVLTFVQFLNRNGHRKKAIHFLHKHLLMKEHTKSCECHAACGLLQLEELFAMDPRIKERATYVRPSLLSTQISQPPPAPRAHSIICETPSLFLVEKIAKV